MGFFSAVKRFFSGGSQPAEEVKQKAVYITTDHNDSPLTNAIRGLWPGLLEQV